MNSQQEDTASTLPWLEKYRPKRLDEMVGNEEVMQRFRGIIASGNMPHLILSGPPGCGKTTALMAMAHALLTGNSDDQNNSTDAKSSSSANSNILHEAKSSSSANSNILHEAKSSSANSNILHEAILELNASDDRGIDVVRNRIKLFASKKVVFPPGAKCKHKLVILDEADSMTPGAQQALRRIIELHADSTRFAFACNVSSKLIEPIQSRCCIIRFGRLSNEQVTARLLWIAKQENLRWTADGIAAVAFAADGDMRQGINVLQSTSAATGGEVSQEAVFRVADMPNPARLERMLNDAVAGRIEEALNTLTLLWSEGYGALELVTGCFRVLKWLSPSSASTANSSSSSSSDGLHQDAIRLAVMKEVGLTHLRVIQGSSSFLQVAGMLSKLMIKDASF